MKENMPVQGRYPLIEKRNIAKDIYDFTILCPQIASRAEPGQFVHIAVPSHALRRPISLCGIDADKGTIRIVFAVKGEGTKKLAEASEGTALDILGPLGHGFAPLKGAGRVLLVGGGIGVPPLLGLSALYKDRATAICGFRDGRGIILQEDFARNGTQTVLCTDDGSYGEAGLVTGPLERLLAEEKYDCVYTCGPEVMMRSVAAIAERHSTPCQVSLERHMGCGIGACLVCACKIRRAGSTEYLHVCKDGPVFNAREVIWE